MRYLGIALIGLACIACGKKAAETAGTAPAPAQVLLKTTGGEAFIPQATAFRMSGDYADNVAVTLNADGTLAYYPAPGDISASSAPYNLGDGWWLNRQGLGANSVFTKWTFDEYRALKNTPSREEILNSIIPGARVTAIKELPLNVSEAFADPERCKKFVE